MTRGLGTRTGRFLAIEDQVLAEGEVGEGLQALEQPDTAPVVPLDELLEVPADEEVLIVDAEAAAEEPVGRLDGVSQALGVQLEAAFAEHPRHLARLIDADVAPRRVPVAPGDGPEEHLR